METVSCHDTALGVLLVGCAGGAVTRLQWVEGVDRPRAPTPLADRAVEQVRAYLAGRRRSFDLPLAPGGTDFQKAVWRLLTQIPYGQTRTYGQLAAALGRPGAARAVGAAVGSNPLWLAIPCHRVVGKDGALTGYAGGLWRKEWLLALERGEKSSQRPF